MRRAIYSYFAAGQEAGARLLIRHFSLAGLTQQSLVSFNSCLVIIIRYSFTSASAYRLSIDFQVYYGLAPRYGTAHFSRKSAAI